MVEEKKSKKDAKGIDIPQTIKDALTTVSNLLGVAVTELWGIFVRQSFVKGVNSLIIALSLLGIAWGMHYSLGWWALVPTVAAHVFIYSAVNYLGNPKYYAIEDIVKKIDEFKRSRNDESKSKPTRTWVEY